MEGVIAAHGGYVNKYVGDEIVAVFGFPASESGKEDRAVLAAFEMCVRFSELTEEWTRFGIPPLRGMGIGIDSGELSFMEIGGKARTQLDVIGSAVNGAARFEALTKELGVRMVIAEHIVRSVPARLIGEYQQPQRKVLEIRGQGARTVFLIH